MGHALLCRPSQNSRESPTSGTYHQTRTACITMVHMITQSVRLPDPLAERLTALAKATRRSKSSFIIEALEMYLEEREDLEAALARFRDPRAEWVDHKEVGVELDLD